jgi:trk system potassium uptake protein TrkH
MILGALNFKLHYHVWMGNRREIVKNIETLVLFVAITVAFIVTAAGLAQTGIYPGAGMLFRKGFYQLVSGHTGTGFQTIYPAQFILEWNPLSIAGVICAMALGGAVCSTTGAIKMLRVGIIFKAMKEDLKRVMLSERAVVVEKFHHIKEVFIEDQQVRSALLVTLCYLILYGLGALAGMYYGYPFMDSLFESTSAAANVGLSCGITDVSMPTGLKITYILQMWAGRLEFMSVFTLLGFFIAAIKGKR